MGNVLGLIVYGGGGLAIGYVGAGIPGGILLAAGGVALQQYGRQAGLNLPLLARVGLFDEGGLFGKTGLGSKLLAGPIKLFSKGGPIDKLGDKIGGTAVKGISVIGKGAKNGLSGVVGVTKGLGRKIGSIPKPKIKIKPIKLPKFKLF